MCVEVDPSWVAVAHCNSVADTAEEVSSDYMVVEVVEVGENLVRSNLAVDRSVNLVLNYMLLTGR